MKLIINHSSMVPIYEQIVNQIKKGIQNNELKVNESLPSVRSLANECKISALTVKKAYDTLESLDLIATIHGKGSYITGNNKALLKEETQKVIEEELAKTMNKAMMLGIDKATLQETIGLLMEDIYD